MSLLAMLEASTSVSAGDGPSSSDIYNLHNSKTYGSAAREHDNNKPQYLPFTQSSVRCHTTASNPHQKYLGRNSILSCPLPMSSSPNHGTSSPYHDPGSTLIVTAAVTFSKVVCKCLAKRLQRLRDPRVMLLAGCGYIYIPVPPCSGPRTWVSLDVVWIVVADVRSVLHRNLFPLRC